MSSNLLKASASFALHGGGSQFEDIYSLGLKWEERSVPSRMWCSLRLMDLLKFIRLVQRSWYGLGRSMQNFRPRPRRDLVPVGSLIDGGRRLWNARFVILQQTTLVGSFFRRIMALAAADMLSLIGNPKTR